MKLNWEIRILTKLRYSCLYIVTSSVRCVLGESRSTTPQAGYQKGPGTDYSGIDSVWIDHTQQPRTASIPICEIPKKPKTGARHKHTNTPDARRIKWLINRNTKKRSTRTQTQATRPTPTQTRHRTDGQKHRHRQLTKCSGTRGETCRGDWCRKGSRSRGRS